MVFFKGEVRYYAFPVIAIATGPTNSISVNAIQNLKSFDQIPGVFYSGNIGAGWFEGGVGSSIGPKPYNTWSIGINPSTSKYGGSFDVRFYSDVTSVAEYYTNFWKGKL